MDFSLFSVFSVNDKVPSYPTKGRKIWEIRKEMGREIKLGLIGTN